MILLNPQHRTHTQPDGRSEEIMRRTIEFFEARGKERLKADDHARAWYGEFLDFVREERIFATLLTPAGEEIIARAASILREMQNIRRTSAELRKADGGSLSIATTHTQARYILPEVIREFRIKYPKVRLHLHQGTSEQIAEMVAKDRVDFAIATGSA